MRVLGLNIAWPRRQKVAQAAAADTGFDAVAAAEATTSGTLDADNVLGKPVREINEKLPTLARAYEPGRISELFRTIRGWFDDLWSEYQVRAEEEFDSVVDEVLQPFVEIPVNIDDQNAKLRNDVKASLLKRAVSMEQARTKMADLKREIRELAIGIWGTPDISPKPTNRVDEALIVAAAFGISLWLDSIFNAPLLRFVANTAIALAFSVAVSLGGSLFSYWSADSLKKKHQWRNADRQREDRFRETRGLDPVTGKEARVFPLPAETDFHIRLNHAFFLGIVVGTTIFRMALSPTLGDMGGSLGFIIVLAGVYAWKIKYGKSVHPREAEYFEKKKELVKTDAEIAQLGVLAGETETRPLFNQYNSDLNNVEARNRENFSVWRQARERFMTLVQQFRDALPWLRDRFNEAAEELAALIGDKLEENRAALDDAIENARPGFQQDFDIERAMREVEEIRAAEPMDIAGRIANFETLRSNLWGEALEEAKRAVDEARQRETDAATLTAEDLAREMRRRDRADLRWRPRIGPRRPPRRTR